MPDVIRLVVRIVGWTGVSLVVGGAWVMLATWKNRPKLAAVPAAALVLLGVALLWCAVKVI